MGIRVLSASLLGRHDLHLGFTERLQCHKLHFESTSLDEYYIYMLFNLIVEGCLYKLKPVASC